MVTEHCRAQCRWYYRDFEKCIRCERPVDGVRMSGMAVHWMVLLGHQNNYNSNMFIPHVFV